MQARGRSDRRVWDEIHPRMSRAFVCQQAPRERVNTISQYFANKGHALSDQVRYEQRRSAFVLAIDNLTR